LTPLPGSLQPQEKISALRSSRWQRSRHTTARFYSARALLFSRGYLERSHTCLVTAVSHLFSDDREICNFAATLDKLRLSRHNVQYGGSLVLPDEAEFAAEFAQRFYTAVSARLK
jgi:uncharacterized protein (UPF0332 family)